jgi:H+/gluconate symporter-like permease
MTEVYANYLKGFLLVLLTWIVPPTTTIIKDVADTMLESDNSYYLEFFRIIVSTLTTILIFVISLIRFFKERKRK